MDAAARKRALSKIPYGLFVVGVRQADRVSGFTATWLSQCSFEPPRVMMAVRADSESRIMIESDRVFTVNFLRRDQQDVAKSFFKKPTVDADKINGIPYRTGTLGCPILERAPAHLECKVIQIIPAGDHTIMVGEVVTAEADSEVNPLTMADTPWSYGG